MAQHYGPNIVTDGLVLCLDAADKNSYTSGSATWSDLSGTGNSVTRTGLPIFIPSGSSAALEFAGSNDDYFSKTSATFDADGSWTVSLWINGWNVGGVPFSAGHPSLGYKALRLNLHTIGLGFWRRDDSNNESAVYILPAPSTSNWTNVVWKYNGSNPEAYINGVSSGTTSWTTGTISSTQIAVGNFLRNAPDNPFDGKIGLVNVYQSALSTEEILQNFNAQRSRFSV